MATAPQPTRDAKTENTLRLIKKYPNRRLYDTANSGYITLADVKQMVLEGIDFQVVDAKSGVSGAGREATGATHFVSVDENVSAYGVEGHRHQSPCGAKSLVTGCPSSSIPSRSFTFCSASLS